MQGLRTKRIRYGAALVIMCILTVSLSCASLGGRLSVKQQTEIIYAWSLIRKDMNEAVVSSILGPPTRIEYESYSEDWFYTYPWALPGGVSFDRETDRVLTFSSPSFY